MSRVISDIVEYEYYKRLEPNEISIRFFEMNGAYQFVKCTIVFHTGEMFPFSVSRFIDTYNEMILIEDYMATRFKGVHTDKENDVKNYTPCGCCGRFIPNTLRVCRDCISVAKKHHVEREEDYKNNIAKVNKEKRCSVYLISDGYTTKIGVSVKPENRLKQLQTSHSKKLFIYSDVSFQNRELAMDVEQELHKHYSQKRLKGEWFNLNANDKINIKERLSSLCQK